MNRRVTSQGVCVSTLAKWRKNGLSLLSAMNFTASAVKRSGRVASCAGCWITFSPRYSGIGGKPRALPLASSRSGTWSLG
jgi:hypothetical protein